MAIVMVRELHTSYRVRKVEDDQITGRQVNAPAQCAALFAAYPACGDGNRLDASGVERFFVAVLDAKNRIRAVQQVSVGTLDGTLVHPRDVFQPAITQNGQAVIVAHNHPSGDPTPSADDGAITMRLQAAGVTLGIPLLDHLVIGHDGAFYSFKQAGRIS